MKNEMQIENIQGIECYEQDGVAYLKLDAVARGLGFTDRSKGAEYVRWSTVRQYLQEIGFSQEVAKDDFIPENIFYRLAMKAKNETAEKFQAKVADEIIPSIRKHGAYMTEDTLEKAVRTHCKGVSEMDIPSDGGIQKRTAERDGAPDQGGIRADREGWILKCRKKSHKKRMPAERPRGGSETEHPLNRAKVCSKKNTLRSGERPMVCPGGRLPHKSYRKRR